MGFLGVFVSGREGLIFVVGFVFFVSVSVRFLGFLVVVFLLGRFFE